MSTSNPNPKKALPSWKIALINSQDKFLAICGKEKETMIELGFATQLVIANPKLQACSIESITNSIINVARTSLTLNPVLQLAHLIPRNGKCVLDISYRGLVFLLKDSLSIKDIQAIIVYGDEQYEESGSPLERPVHKKKYAKTKSDHKTRGYIGVYSQVLLFDNTVIYTPLKPYWEILEAEKISPSSSNEYSPWQTWREDMIKKTKIKYDAKTLMSSKPSDRINAALAIEQENEGANFQLEAPTMKGLVSKSQKAAMFGDDEITPSVTLNPTESFLASGPEGEIIPMNKSQQDIATLFDNSDEIPEHERIDNPANITENAKIAEQLKNQKDAPSA